MKISITGHTQGIGLELYNCLTRAGHEVQGFDLTTGHDIADGVAQREIIESLESSDVFINNAYHPVGQTALLRKAIQFCRGTTKTVVHVGSIVALNPNPATEEQIEFLKTWVPSLGPEYYGVKKQQLDIINTELFVSKTKIIHLMPDVVNTPSIEQGFPFAMLDAHELAIFVTRMLSQKTDFFIHQIAFSNLGAP